MRLIDADALIEEIKADMENDDLNIEEINAILALEQAPTIEIVIARGTDGIIIPLTRPKGKWITDKLHNTVCSICGGIRRDSRFDHIDFCNKCGAQME